MEPTAHSPGRFAATEDEREQYRQNGFFVRERVFDEAEVARFRAAVEAIHARVVRSANAREAPPVELVDDKRYQELEGSTVKWEWRERAEVRSMEPFLHLDSRLDGLIDDPRLLEPAAAATGVPQMSLFTDKLNFKRPGGAPFPWHQDSPYWAFGCDHLDRLSSLQIYLDDTHKENGCLWMVAGSHRRGRLPVHEDRGTLGRLYTREDAIEGTPVPIEVPAGSVSFFHGDVVHGSRGNRGRTSRRAMVLSFQPAGHPRWRRDDIRNVG